jgi:hypothetical protein
MHELLYLFGMIVFVVLMLFLLASIWQEYKEELEKHRATLNVYDEMEGLDRVSSVERPYLERDTEPIRAMPRIVLTPEEQI